MKSTTTILALLTTLLTPTLAEDGRNYAQCGGKQWSGETTCNEGWTCTRQNDYYSQCLQGSHSAVSAAGGSSCSSSTVPIAASGVASGAGAGAGPSSVHESHASGTAKSVPSAVHSSAANPSSSSSSGTSGSSGGGVVSSGSCGALSGSKSGYATTTHYYDGQEGACGCGTNGAMSSWQSSPGTKLYTAAGSQNLFAGDGSTSSWCGSGCGKCFELTNVGAVAASGQGSCDGKGESITVMVTNLCPAQGNQQWCSTPQNEYGFGAHFDVMSQGGPEGWNNPVVSYKEVTCPGSLTSDYATCQCAAGKMSRVRRGLLG